MLKNTILINFFFVLQIHLEVQQFLRSQSQLMKKEEQEEEEEVEGRELLISKKV